MKTTKTLIAALLVLVTATAFAQAKKGLFVSVEYSHEMNRVETWASHFNERISPKNSHEAELPIISQTFYSDVVDITYENDSFIESWMSAPFEEAFYEDAMSLEDWMSDAFETDELQEEIIEIEDWMTVSNW